MNETSAPSQPGTSLLPDGIGAITTIHMVLMALVAIAAIAIILVGIRRKRERTHAERQVRINARDAGVPTIEEAARPEAEPEPEAAVAPPPPVPAAPVTPPPPPPVVVEPAPAAIEPQPLDDEPIAAAAPLDASPATIAAPVPVPEPVPVEAATPAPAAPPVADANAPDTPVTQLKGLGPKLAAKLASLGITTVGQLAALSPAEAESLDAQLGPFTGRMARDRWIEQARLLAAGDRAGFEAVFGRL